jgi:c-di-GMP-binding flagellar brake protein YcgR
METTKSRWDTIFIGSKPKRYFVLEQPKVNGLPVKLDDNSKWSVNFINNGQVFNFNCEVLGCCARPVPLVFMSYPEVVDQANLRNAKRYPVNIPMIIEGAGEPNTGTLAKGLVLDLSMGGCLVATTTEIPAEMELLMTLYLDDHKTIAGLHVERKSGRQAVGTYYSGLAFLTSHNPEVFNQVHDLINGIENIPLRI